METGTRMNKVFLSGLCNNASHAFAAASLLNTCVKTRSNKRLEHTSSVLRLLRHELKCSFVEYSMFSALIEKNDDLIIENKDISLSLFLTM